MSKWKLGGEEPPGGAGGGRLVLANRDVVVYDGPDRRVLFYASTRSNRPKPPKIQAALDAGCMTWPADEWEKRWEALGWKLISEGVK